jgi:methionyl-tRNA formyltransferase
VARLAFFGTPAVAASCLVALAEAGHEIVLVVTAPDRRRGRGQGPVPTPVKESALALGLPVSERVADVVTTPAELGVVVAFGRLVKPDVLARVPMVNLHFSMLPRWRGAAPVERAILAGDDRTGVCLMKVEEGLDTGGLYVCATTAIGPDETAEELRRRLGEMGTELLLARLARVAGGDGGTEGFPGLGEPVPQVGEATYAEKLHPDELRLDFTRPAIELQRVVRVGRAWTVYDGKRLLVHRAAADRSPAGTHPPGSIENGRVATADGWLVPLEVQAEGRKRQGFSEWCRGVRLKGGATLS